MDASNPRKKIVFLIGSLAGGGAERVFVTLLRHLDRSYFEPHLVLLRAGGEFACQVPRDVAIHTLRGGQQRRTPLGLLLLMWSLIQLLWKIRPRIVLSTGRINLMLALARPLLPRGTKLLIRECSVLSVRLKTDTRYPNLWRWLYKRLYRRADNVVCPSDSMVKDMTEQFHLPHQQPMRIYNPIDLDLVRELGRSGGNPYSGAGPHLVAAGRLSNEKGFDLLLAAMPKVVECLPDVRLTILGQGPLQNELAEQVKKLGLQESVSFVGFQQNPWPYLCHADLFVLPSRRESFGNVLLEALALETPAVAADCPGAIREIYGSNPSVRLVPAGNSIVLAEAIIERCRAARHEPIHAKASPDWINKFALQRIIGEYSALFLGDDDLNLAANKGLMLSGSLICDRVPQGD
ncbi:MAG TPA: glycosyltransferase [Candidatus Angelobacter sp.]|nr:glycosyltransferase [Candidatus Angelobacter sp.]